MIIHEEDLLNALKLLHAKRKEVKIEESVVVDARQAREVYSARKRVRDARDLGGDRFRGFSSLLKKLAELRSNKRVAITPITIDDQYLLLFTDTTYSEIYGLLSMEPGTVAFERDYERRRARLKATLEAL